MSENRTASPKGGRYSELPIGLRYHAKGPACPEWAREGSRLFGALLKSGEATFMVDMKINQMLNLAAYVLKVFAHRPEVMFVDQYSDQGHKAGEKSGEKERPVIRRVQRGSPAAGCRCPSVYAEAA